jgi:putative Ca2+/H+ antiporter (TMEM165/GDT1 family)
VSETFDRWVEGASPARTDRREARVHPLVVLIVFAVIALAELPDKSMFASLLLSTRYRASWVFVGVATAFAVHIVIAVTAGGLLALLPHRAVNAIVAAMFLAGAAVLLWRQESEEVEEGLQEGVEVEGRVRIAPTFRRVVLTAFAVVFVGEWGDITQIATANYAARYHDPLSVGVGAILGLWAVAALAVSAGRRVLSRVPVGVLRRSAGVVLLLFAALSAVQAAR